MNSTERIFQDLKEQIINGTYPPSFSLTETDLAKKYDVSRNTIKKCLMMLESEGLVSIEHNKSAKVRSYSIEEVMDFLDLREVLEGFIIRNAVQSITAEQIGEMERLMAEMKELMERRDLLGYSQRNQQFHKVIYDACTNQTAVEMTIRLKNQMRKYNSKTILIPGRDTSSFDEHARILETIKEKDVESAELCMRLHIRNVRKTFQDNFFLLF